jgi:Arc/MetJ-type ribon-helix-helix transcriptional regulator
MAAISKIDRGPIEATDYAAKVPQEQWPMLVQARRAFLQINLPYDCRELLRFVDEAQPMLRALGYKNVPDFIRRGLDLDPSLVQWAIHGLRTIQPDVPIPFAMAVQTGKEKTKACAESATPLAKHGGDRTREQEQGAVRTLLRRGSESASYLTARIARDRPDILKKMKAGEYKSVRAAARDAGILKLASPFDLLKRAWGKASEEERTAFVLFIREDKKKAA